MGRYDSWAEVAAAIRTLINDVERLQDHVHLPGGLRPVKYAEDIKAAFRALDNAAHNADHRHNEDVSDQRHREMARQRVRGIPELIGHLPEALQPDTFGEERQRQPNELQIAEREALIRVITDCRGNMTRVAARLGMSTNTLYRRMKRHGIPSRRSASARSTQTVAA